MRLRTKPQGSALWTYLGPGPERSPPGHPPALSFGCADGSFSYAQTPLLFQEFNLETNKQANKQTKDAALTFPRPSRSPPGPRSRVPPRHRPHFPLLRKAHTKEGRFPKSPSRPRPLQNSSNQKERKKKNVEKKAQVVFLGQTNKQTKQTLRLTSPVGPCVSGVAETVGLIRRSRGTRVPAQVRVRAYQPSPKTHGN